MQTDEFIQDFIDEAKTHIEKIEVAFLDVEAFRNSDILINDVFRAVHSIKGTAGFFQLKKIVSLSHSMENVLGKIRDKTLQITEDVLDCLLLCNDTLKLMIEDVKNSEDVNIESYLERLDVIVKKNQEQQPKTSKIEENITKEETLINKNISSKQENIKNLHVYGKMLTLVPTVASMQIDDKYVEAIINLIKKGHKVYKVVITYDNKLDIYFDNPSKLFAELAQIGKVIDCFTDIHETHDIDEIIELLKFSEGNNPIRLEILVTSVLELSFFCEAISIGSENIVQVNSDNVLKGRCDEEDSKNETVPVILKNDETIRVNVELLESLMAMSSEMVLSRNQLLNAFKNKNTDNVDMSRILQNIDKLTSKMQEKIMLTRMQPIGNIFNKFPRIIKEISKKIGKDITLHIEGKDVELDKSMIEALSDPITHLVRNAADHGIESPTERERAQKSVRGSITLNAFHKSGMIVIKVSDDGGGIDFEAVKNKAVEKKIITKLQAENISDSDVNELILKPGFSTSKIISDISGRGVGMDVVKSNVEKLGGTVEISSKKGLGTTISLFMPRTLAIMRSLMVQVGEHRFVIPENSVSEVVRIKKNEKDTRLKKIYKSKELLLRDCIIPIVDISDVLEFPMHEKGEVVIVVLKYMDRSFGILVNSVADTEEILVKPLPKCLKNCFVYSGITIMGDGKIAMILDIDGIVRKAGIQFSSENKQQVSIETNQRENIMLEYQNMILFKCSGNETYAIDMNMVSRVETVRSSEIEEIGDKSYVILRGKAIRVIRPESYLPVKNNPYKQEKLTVIVPNLISHPIGILVDKVIDNVKSRFELDTESICAQGIFGTAIYNKNIMLILNIYELFEMADPINYPKVETNINITKRVLIVEDTPFFQHIEAKYLEASGCTVTIAENGKQALQILKEKSFDVIVSDLIMPIMGGLELIQLIRKDDKLKNIPAIAVTSMTSDFYVKQILENGFDAFECKLNKETLIKTVNNVLKSRRGGMQI